MRTHARDAEREAAEIEEVHGGDRVGALLLALVLDVRVAAMLPGTRRLLRQADALDGAEHAEHTARRALYNVIYVLS